MYVCYEGKFQVNQNYDKILERDYSSPAWFEH